MREWGRYLEDELVGVEIVIMNALTSGSIHLPTSSVRGRDAQPDLFATLEQAEAVVDSAWSPDIAVYVRQVLALRFDTLHGSAGPSPRRTSGRAYRTARTCSASPSTAPPTRRARPSSTPELHDLDDRVFEPEEPTPTPFTLHADFLSSRFRDLSSEKPRRGTACSITCAQKDPRVCQGSL